MKIKKFDPARHYEVVCGWWREWGWPEIPLHSLPATGLLICGEKPICCGWIYKTDSNFCWLEWIVSDPKAKKARRGKAVDLLIDALIEEAKMQGFGTVFTSVRNPRLQKRLEDNGFTVSDENVTHLVRVFTCL